MTDNGKFFLEIKEMIPVLYPSPNAIQMDETDFPVRGVHICILDHAYFTRFSDTKVKQLRRRRGGGGRETDRTVRQTGRAACQKESPSPLQQELSAGAVRAAINKKCFLP